MQAISNLLIICRMVRSFRSSGVYEFLRVSRLTGLDWTGLGYRRFLCCYNSLFFFSFLLVRSDFAIDIDSDEMNEEKKKEKERKEK